jgi:hypothetical protein
VRRDYLMVLYDGIEGIAGDGLNPGASARSRYTAGNGIENWILFVNSDCRKPLAQPVLRLGICVNPGCSRGEY